MEVDPKLVSYQQAKPPLQLQLQLQMNTQENPVYLSHLTFILLLILVSDILIFLKGKKFDLCQIKKFN
jgi:hypothetical protein